MFTAAAALAGSVRPDDGPPGWLRLTAAEPTSEQAAADARSSRSEATIAALASDRPSVARRGVALANLGDVGMVRRTTGWRAGVARAPLRGRRASRRRTGHPLPSGCRPARRPSARLAAAALRPPLPPTNSRPGSRTELDSTGGATGTERVVSTDAAEVVRRHPHAFVGARFRHHAEAALASVSRHAGRGCRITRAATPRHIAASSTAIASDRRRPPMRGQIVHFEIPRTTPRRAVSSGARSSGGRSSRFPVRPSTT